MIHEERPGEQVGDPGRELERAQADDEGGERAPEHPRCNPVGQFGSPLRDAKRKIRGAPCGRPIAAASPRRGQGPGAPPWPDSRPGIDGGSYLMAPRVVNEMREADRAPRRDRCDDVFRGVWTVGAIPGVRGIGVFGVCLRDLGDPQGRGPGGGSGRSSRCSGRVPSRMRSASSGLPTTFSSVPWVICLESYSVIRRESTRFPRRRTFT